MLENGLGSSTGALTAVALDDLIRPSLEEMLGVLKSLHLALALRTGGGAGEIFEASAESGGTRARRDALRLAGGALRRAAGHVRRRHARDGVRSSSPSRARRGG